MVAFQMWGQYRQLLMAEHRFYVTQAKKRLLSQFDNMERDAKQAAADYLADISRQFNSDYHDEGSFYEAAHDEEIAFYLSLSEMCEHTRLSVIAGMFHEWEKKLKDWLIDEIRHWHIGPSIVRSIHKQDFRGILDLLASFGFDVRSMPFHNRLNAMRLVVNVFKHGDGGSFDDLKASYPEFFPDSQNESEYPIPLHFLDHTNMKVNCEHLESFSEAILAFWGAVPENIYFAGELDVPDWFAKAYEKDKGESK